MERERGEGREETIVGGIGGTGSRRVRVRGGGGLDLVGRTAVDLMEEVNDD